MEKEFYAHIRLIPTDEKQTVTAHCRAAAKHASEALSEIQLSDTGYLSGLLHDMGKMTEEYGDYLFKAVYENDNSARGSLIHTFTGTRYILENFWNFKDEEGFFPVAAEIIAFAIASHHGQIDCVDEHHKSGFVHRLSKDDIRSPLKIQSRSSPRVLFPSYFAKSLGNTQSIPCVFCFI